MTEAAPTTAIAAVERVQAESIRQFLDQLRREKPGLFVERAVDEIVDEIEEDATRTTKRDGWRLNVQDYLSDVMPQLRRPPPREGAAERRARLLAEVGVDRATLLATITAETIIGDKPLGAWVIAQLRAMGGVFAFILDVAGTSDDSRLVRDVMKPKHWRALRRSGR
jgi:hypothetical protein